MTPERIAADCIAQAALPRLCAVPDCASSGCVGAEHAGRAAVEAISAAGLVIIPAARLAALLDLARAARALAGSEEQMRQTLAGEDTSRAFDPWPEADALVASLRVVHPQ